MYLAFATHGGRKHAFYNQLSWRDWFPLRECDCVQACTSLVWCERCTIWGCAMMFLFEGVGGVWKSWTKDSLVGEGYLGNVRYPIPLIIVPLLRQKVLRGGKCPFKSATIVSSSHFSSPFLSTSRQRANKVHVSLPSSLICFFFLPLIYFITFLFHS